jgi:Uncharacterized protein conserved in bacteria (DUF2188)
MVKLKVLDKLKPKKKEPEPEEKPTPPKSEEVAQSETVQDPKEPTLAEYHETLHSSDVASENKDSSYQRDGVVLSEQRFWRDVKAIEENVDNISKHEPKMPEAGLGKTVDEILAKTKKKLATTEKKPRKPSNVIYVVSKPQPGQVRGDWAVRSHGKIYSYHRLKESAIKQARNIARERKATVLIQNTDGTFSEGFKPRPKK